MAMDDERIEDLAVPAEQTEDVKGGVAAGDVNGDGAEPDQPVIGGAVPRKIPGLHKASDVTLKRG